MTTTTIPAEVEIAIVGAGPAGLTAAIELAALGVDVALFERRDSTSPLPRAHLLNQRTMEIFDDLGVAADVYAMSPPDDRWHRVAWYTSLGGERPGQGREIGHMHAWGGGPDAGRYAAASPNPYANVPQMRLDRALADHAEKCCPGRIFFGHEVVEIDAGGDGVELDVHVVSRGESRKVHARYVIGADGGRTITKALGVPMVGPTELLDMVTMHVTADLSPWITDEQVLLYYFIDPKGQGGFRGTICAMGPDTWGSQTRQWAFHQAFPMGSRDSDDIDTLSARFRDIVGIPDLEFDIQAVSHWTFEGVVAERYRVGNAFLVGNSAHRHPPTGGLGLNTAVQDVHNLCWKLAHVLRGQADDALLDTYGAERRPVGEFNVAHSLENAGGHRRIAAALGLTEDITEEDGWAQIDAWSASGPDGDARRRAVADAVGGNGDDYSQLNVELGYVYESGAVVGDGTQAPRVDNPLRDYTPTTRPGHHLPHAWVLRDGRRVSTIHAIDHARHTLLVDPFEAQVWEHAVDVAGVPVTVIALASIDSAGEPQWDRIREVSPGGAILVRPDAHVAWRTMAMPDNPAQVLQNTMRTISFRKEVLA